MYCPKCASQNIDSARFCRSCGTNLSLVPQALSGRLPELQPDRFERRRRRRREPSLARGARKAFLGLGFLIAAIALFFTIGAPVVHQLGLLIPAFILLGKGIGEIVSASRAESRKVISPTRAAEPTGELSPRPLFDPLSPPSVTEGTTRHMDPVPERRRERS